VLFSCESNPASTVSEVPPVVIRSAHITPALIQFTPDHGVKDTTVTVQLEVEIEPISPKSLTIFGGSQPVRFTWELISRTSGDLKASGSQQISPLDASILSTIPSQISIDLRTFDFADYTLYAYFTDGERLYSNTLQRVISVRGFPIGTPEILSVTSPGNVFIPASGSRTFSLTAKVKHPLDRQLIERVLVEIRDSRNILLGGAPFQLFDDGSLVSIGNGTSGDQTAADSIYTRAFQVNSSNNPESYTLLFYALDPYGGSSDSVSSTMTFTR